jgi:hypothetical protein
MEYKISNVTEDQDIINYIAEQDKVKVINDATVKDFVLTKFALEDIGLPSHADILKGVLAIKEEVGLQGWTTDKGSSDNYQGFSLTYNPDFLDTSVSIYHQTWGSKNLTQIFGREDGIGTHSQLKNTYYDSYGFRKRLPLVDKHLGFLLDKFSMTMVRSRVAFLNLHNRRPHPSGWHKDEYPYQLIRLLIPLQTSNEYILEIEGNDEFGNSSAMKTHLPAGNLYTWNTRIPHRVGLRRRCRFEHDRIHLILGFSPWYDYNEENDSYVKSALYGMPINQIINEKLFIAAK